MNTSIVDAIRDTAPGIVASAARMPAPLDMAGAEMDDDLGLLPVPPWQVTEAVVIGCAIAFATVAGFFLGLTYEGCLIGVCG